MTNQFFLHDLDLLHYAIQDLCWVRAMSVHRLLSDNNAFDPDEVGVLVSTYESALRHLRVSDLDDPTAIAVARMIVELAKEGVRDGAQLRDAVLTSFQGSNCTARKDATSTLSRLAGSSVSLTHSLPVK